MEQVASETEVKKITPQDVGLEADSNFFTSLDSVKAILPNDMSGKEIKEKYNIDFPINDLQYTNQQYNNTSWQKNQLSLSNLEGVQPSISQENKQVTNDLTLSN